MAEGVPPYLHTQKESLAVRAARSKSLFNDSRLNRLPLSCCNEYRSKDLGISPGGCTSLAKRGVLVAEIRLSIKTKICCRILLDLPD